MSAMSSISEEETLVNKETTLVGDDEVGTKDVEKVQDTKKESEEPCQEAVDDEEKWKLYPTYDLMLDK